MVNDPAEYVPGVWSVSVFTVVIYVTSSATIAGVVTMSVKVRVP
jgi:hypothetical protein